MTQPVAPRRILTLFTETFGLGRAAAFTTILFIALVAVSAAFWFVKSAPPSDIIITTGPVGSLFQTNAEKYRVILARNHVKLTILPSHGSMENLQRLNDPSFRVDIGLVQGGVTNGADFDRIVSLGSISYQPLLVFYRGTSTVETLSQLSGKRLVIGAEGSGTRLLVLNLLAANGIEPGGSTMMTNLDAEEASNALLKGDMDAVFLMGDSASPQIMRQLLRSQQIQLMNFAQADGYTRRIRYLNKLELPRGSIDFGKNLPTRDVNLVGPTVELLARADLHPAICDLLLEAAREVHGRASLMQRRGEFPAPLEHDFAISDEATRYYKSGKSFFYRHLPFWIASLVNRIVVVIVPAIVLLIPAVRVIPTLLRLRVKLRLYRWYRALLLLDRELLGNHSGNREELLKRLDDIEKAVNRMKVPASFADQFYGLRGHINFVRDRLAQPV
jgi:TRAP-type uncharacterized transport system substrate-binding protein